MDLTFCNVRPDCFCDTYSRQHLEASSQQHWNLEYCDHEKLHFTILPIRESDQGEENKNCVYIEGGIHTEL